jgi:hypothetical protein
MPEMSEFQSGANTGSDAPLPYPDNRVIGAVGTDRLGDLVPALVGAGFAPIGILAGEGGLRRLRGTGGGAGVTGLLRRFAMSTGGDLDYVRGAEQAVRDGRALVDVEVDDEAGKDRARDILVRHGAYHVAFFGPWPIETLA